MRKLTTEEFIERAIKIHNGKYDYSKVEYVNAKTKICIVCPLHGEFMQYPNDHLKGQGCRKCGDISRSIKNRYNTEDFIFHAKETHGDKYDYSKVEYVNAKTKVCIICPIHGEFWQSPTHHIMGYNCPKCAKETISKKKKELSDFIKGELTQEKLKFVLTYNEKTGEFTWNNTQKTAGSNTGYGYITISICGKPYMAHRLAWLYMNGEFPNGQIDHINRNRKDNRICNLRVVSNQLNQTNRNVQKNSTSGYTGVSFKRNKGVYESHIMINGKYIHLGCYSTLKEAIDARITAEMENNFLRIQKYE